MNIQKIRYKNAFSVSFAIDPEIKNFCTVKLIVQPILENAIYYGVKDMDEDGKIAVRGYLQDGDIYISVMRCHLWQICMWVLQDSRYHRMH